MIKDGNINRPCSLATQGPCFQGFCLIVRLFGPKIFTTKEKKEKNVRLSSFFLERIIRTPILKFALNFM